MNATALAHPGDSMRALTVPRDADDMYCLAERMFKAGLVPQSFKSIEGAFLAMMKGAQYGLLPQQSLAGFYVIGNIAHPYGTCLRGIVRASRDFSGDMEGCIEGVAELRHMCNEENPYKPETDTYGMFFELQRSLRRRLARVNERAGKDGTLPAYFCGFASVKRKGEAPVSMLFDSFDAQRGELSNKDMWKKWPQRMHMHRAGTFVRRDVFADALMGLDMTVEEALELTPEQRENAIAVHAEEVQQPASPGQSLDNLARPSGVLELRRGDIAPRAPARERNTVSVEAPARAPVEDAPPPATGAARSQIYAGQGNAPPSSDMPHQSDDPKAQEQPIGTENTPPPAAKKRSPGAAALMAAQEACRAAGLDPAEVGKTVMLKTFGEGVKTADISDNEKAQVAQKMQQMVAQSGAPDTDEPPEAEDETDF